MNKGILKYSNGWGHLIMSLATMATGLYLVVAGGVNSAYGLTLLGLVTTAWFIPGAAKQVAYQIEKQTGSAPAGAVGTGATDATNTTAV